jgi:hypothetical protein
MESQPAGITRCFFSQALSSTLYKIPREFGFVDGADMPRPARIVRSALSFAII